MTGAFTDLLIKELERTTMLQLPNGKQVDETMLEAAMEDGSLEHKYFLHTQNGEVVLLSEYDDPDESEKLAEEIDGSSQYVPIERIPTHIAYQWMEDFVENTVAPRDEQAAEKLSIALRGKGAFRRFKDVLHGVGDAWVQEWYHWRDIQLKAAMRVWFESVLEEITDENDEKPPN